MTIGEEDWKKVNHIFFDGRKLAKGVNNISSSWANPFDVECEEWFAEVASDVLKEAGVRFGTTH